MGYVPPNIIQQIWSWIENDYRWAFIIVPAAVLISAYLLLHNKITHQTRLETIRSKCFIILASVVICVAAFIAFQYYLLRPFLSTVYGLPENQFTVLIANYEPISKEAAGEAKNFNDEIFNSLLKIHEVHVIRKSIRIEGDDIIELTRYARTIGFKHKANVVIFGNVRKTSSNSYEYPSYIVLTEGAITPFQNEIVVRDSKYKGVLEPKGWNGEYFYAENIKISDVDDAIYSLLGIKYLRDRDYEKAVRCFYSVKTRTADIDFYLGLCCNNLGRYKESVEAYDLVLAQFPDNKETIINRLVSFQKLEQAKHNK